MKKLISGAFLLIFLQTAVFAQCNPQFGAATYTGTSVVSGVQTVGLNETGQLHFSFGVGSDPACNSGAGNTPGTITMTISFSNSYGPASAADISGPQASLYDWIWDPASHTLIGLNNAPIPLGAPADFTVNVKGLALTPGVVAPLTTLNWFSETNPPITNTMTGDDINSVGLNVDTALPVTLVNFAANKEGKLANLKWSTTMETNSDRFEIEHSLNGKNWNKIGTVTSNGESSSLKSYSFTDKNPADGENLYRLRMVDRDATFAYSRIISLAFDSLNADMSVYPNPATDKIILRDFSNITKVLISDMNGRTVLQSDKTASGEINVKNLPTGTYAVKIIRSDGGISTQKLAVVK
ncbi:T9SS type A sorting domain-containing protein [Dyadobacter subterraneus]|uniref:T9SS type A sorting domain-containing protein n=1 Tax=Dyadobacter subterraneus TaxID=2773304 RepID=A0ABR9W8Z8_9BACT|nr:T9SS type A sorting domain-containing protein [Dyadobacter subterraneus]MBE9461416.1 T9SS type A sorting domain-containing protein [Dyadobacter subterraneus]